MARRERKTAHTLLGEESRKSQLVGVIEQPTLSIRLYLVLGRELFEFIAIGWPRRSTLQGDLSQHFGCEHRLRVDTLPIVLRLRGGRLLRERRNYSEELRQFESELSVQFMRDGQRNNERLMKAAARKLPNTSMKPYNVFRILVPKRGLEPPRPCGH